MCLDMVYKYMESLCWYLLGKYENQYSVQIVSTTSQHLLQWQACILSVLQVDLNLKHIPHVTYVTHWTSLITLCHVQQMGQVKVPYTTYCGRNGQISGTQSQKKKVPERIKAMDNKQLQYWLSRFVLEVRKGDGSEYPPNTLHHICCGLLRHIRQSRRPEVDFFNTMLLLRLNCMAGFADLMFCHGTQTTDNTE